MPQARAARIAWEAGLRAEAFGNRGVWRFGETVIEKVPWD
ncbi:hypothetical protein K373_04020 [Streptomyces sp. DvalAA-21]|nr:hypothetical protein SACTE_5076 [Streptomyces sp. SirexAA-E]PZX36468.1 hypothetical protein K373_04020 [Streptomyces sp. DvalAA-21]RAJ31437.1 hypothetical protein K351_04261 [Streptomyces sp. DpondAA-E10]RAJ46605.1 hypothetical protein K352_03655 [Streptomyces sp. DpondAA-A50]SCD52846.1 hypothetical protein GA0115239_103018 [Streptomyces sp. BpilaLS-43]SCD88057.1 hypothetical protein GA0115235_109616 [Streptomyces sp. DpondAA-F4a]SCL93456.1 hypothetical protein SAMN04883147_103981 [Strepto